MRWLSGGPDTPEHILHRRAGSTMEQGSHYCDRMKSKYTPEEIAAALRRLRDEDPSLFAAVVVVLRRICSR